jgi:hypothetical protein
VKGFVAMPLDSPPLQAPDPPLAFDSAGRSDRVAAVDAGVPVASTRRRLVRLGAAAALRVLPRQVRHAATGAISATAGEHRLCAGTILTKRVAR